MIFYEFQPVYNLFWKDFQTLLYILLQILSFATAPDFPANRVCDASYLLFSVNSFSLHTWRSMFVRFYVDYL